MVQHQNLLKFDTSYFAFHPSVFLYFTQVSFSRMFVIFQTHHPKFQIICETSVTTTKMCWASWLSHGLPNGQGTHRGSIAPKTKLILHSSVCNHRFVQRSAAGVTPRLCPVELSLLAQRKEDSARNADEFPRLTLLVDFHGKFGASSTSAFPSSQCLTLRFQMQQCARW